MRKVILLLAALWIAPFPLSAKVVCKDGLCYMVPDDAPTNMPTVVTDAAPVNAVTRIAQGYMPKEDFIAFLEGREKPAPLAERGIWLVLLLTLLGGLAMNLTPCVLPMIPINLMIIGRSASLGAAYGAGMALAYGALGVVAAIGGVAFGTIQSSPWFNLSVSLVFAALAGALGGAFALDFSRWRPRTDSLRNSTSGMVFALVTGAFSAVLAGACVAPILVSVLLLTADGYAKGNLLALALPFVLGLGMALPWPLVGAGLHVLPKPGNWMRWVNRGFALVVLGFAAWYGRLAWLGFDRANTESAIATSATTATPADFDAQLAKARQQAKPILVDCWATWCKNCTAMERVMNLPEVHATLERFTIIRLQAEDIGELRRLPGFETVQGLPAFVILK